MKLFKKNQPDTQISRRDALGCKPVRNPQVISARMDSGGTVLTFTVVLRPWFVRFYERFGKSSSGAITKKLQLDELGTAVWDMINGVSTVQQIVEAFAKKYQLHGKEAEVAVTRFIRDLGKRGLIGLK